MKHTSVSIIDPLTAADLAVLRAFGTGTITPKTIAAESDAERLDRAKSEQVLAARGFLQKLPEAKRTKGAPLYVVTPEGLACVLDLVPIEDLTPAAHAAG